MDASVAAPRIKLKNRCKWSCFHDPMMILSALGPTTLRDSGSRPSGMRHRKTLVNNKKKNKKIKIISYKIKAIKTIKSYIQFWHRQPWVSNPPPSLLIAPFLQPNHLLWSSSLLLLKYQNSKGEVWRGSTIFIKVFRKEPKRLVLRFVWFYT